LTHFPAPIGGESSLEHRSSSPNAKEEAVIKLGVLLVSLLAISTPQTHTLTDGESQQIQAILERLNHDQRLAIGLVASHILTPRSDECLLRVFRTHRSIEVAAVLCDRGKYSRIESTLIDPLYWDSPDTTDSAGDLISKWADPETEAVQKFTTALAARDPRRQRLSASMLGRLAHISGGSTGALLDLIVTGSEESRPTAAAAVVVIGVDDGSLDRTRKLLRHPDPRVQTLAAWILGKLSVDIDHATAQMITLLHADSDEAIAAFACDALIALGETDVALTRLRSLLESQDPNIRLYVLQSIDGCTLNDSWFEGITRCLEPSYPAQCTAAIHVLTQLDPAAANAWEPLFELAFKSKTSPEIRHRAIDAIIELREAAVPAIPSLVTIIKNESTRAPDAARVLIGLNSIVAPSASLLHDIIRDGPDMARLRAMRCLGPILDESQDSVRLVAETATNRRNSQIVRTTALSVLELARDLSADIDQECRSIAKDDELPSVQAAAHRALALRQASEHFVIASLSGAHPEVQVAILDRHTTHKDILLIATATQLLQSTNSSVRLAAAKFLVSVNRSDAALPTIRELAKDPDHHFELLGLASQLGPASDACLHAMLGGDLTNGRVISAWSALCKVDPTNELSLRMAEFALTHDAARPFITSFLYLRDDKWIGHSLLNVIERAKDSPADATSRSYLKLIAHASNRLRDEHSNLDLRRLREELANTSDQLSQSISWRRADIPEMEILRTSLKLLCPTDSRVEASLTKHIDSLESPGVLSWGLACVGAILLHFSLIAVLLLVYPHSRGAREVFHVLTEVRLMRLSSLLYLEWVVHLPRIRLRLIDPYWREWTHKLKERGDYLPRPFDRGGIQHPDGSSSSIEGLAGWTTSRARALALVGSAGSGKSVLLRHLAATSSVPSAYLDSTEWRSGVIKSVQELFTGRARKSTLIGHLIEDGVVALYLDGLNEVDAETRYGALMFARNHANAIVATQPLVDARDLKPFDIHEMTPYPRDIAKEYLHHIYPHSGQGDWGERCERFLDLMFGGSEQESGLVDRTPRWSNPFDLSLASALLAEGLDPTPTRLLDQQHKVLSNRFREKHDREFPLAAVAKAVHSRWQAGIGTLSDEGLEAEFVALQEQRLVVVQRFAGVDSEKNVEIRFRHDRVRDFYLGHALADAGEESYLHRHSMGDERLSGAYLALVWILELGELARLQTIGNLFMSRSSNLSLLRLSSEIQVRLDFEGKHPKNARVDRSAAIE